VSRFWPLREAAQADYEALRAAVLAGTPRCDPAADRFERAGLWGLIRRPAADPAFLTTLVGALRPPWSPHADPRLDALAETYRFVVGAGGTDQTVPSIQEVGS
jgi:hypothetical protein